MADTPSTKHRYMVGLTPRLNVEVRTIAEREDESVSAILRRLIRNGLDAERRSATAVSR